MMGVLYSPSDLSLDDLIETAQADPYDDTAAMAEILTRFEVAILATANGVTTEWNARQDAAQGARLGLVKAVRKHRPGTAGFKSYARRHMRTEAVRTLRAMDSRRPTAFGDVPERSERSQGRRHWGGDREPQPFTIESVSRTLSPEQRAVVAERYLHDREMADIARDLGVSVPAVSQRLKTIHNGLRPLVIKAATA